MKIVFMGTSQFAVPSLEALIEAEQNVVGVVTKPDRPQGRGRKLKPSPIKEISEEKGLLLFQPVTVKDPAFVSKIKASTPDIIAVVSFGQILSRDFLDIPSLGCVNLHPSLLPKYRGAAPVQWALIKGEKVTGVTTMCLDEGMDTGDILLQQEVEIEGDDTGETLQDRLAKIGARLLLETFHRLKEGAVSPVPQDHTQASQFPPLQKEDGRIDWEEENTQISNLVRGLFPWPGAFSSLQGKRLKILKGVALEGDSKDIPSGIITEAGERGIKVSTGKGFFVITELQLQDHRSMKADDFFRGHKQKIPPGTVLG